MNGIRVCVLFLTCWQFVNAQNLIADSSFEKNGRVPLNFSEIGVSNSWSGASWGTTDLFCKCSKKQKKLSLVNVPQNPMGYQYPHSGNCYAGLFAHSHGYYREYLQTQLINPLEKGKSYLFTMYVSLADYSRASIDQMGVCFLTSQAQYNFSHVIVNLKPVYMKFENEYINDTANWHRLTAIYQSHGGEQFLLIGSFAINEISRTKVKAPKERKSRINQVSERDAYYFIDDVSLIEVLSNELRDTIAENEIEPSYKILNKVSFVLKNVLFQTNETALLPSSCFELDLIAEHLKSNVEIRIQILGHTDNSGKEKVNKRLSIGRAKAVSEYLTDKGVEKGRITYDGYGSLKPVASNNTEEGKKLNRRVELILNR